VDPNWQWTQTRTVDPNWQWTLTRTVDPNQDSGPWLDRRPLLWQWTLTRTVDPKFGSGPWLWQRSLTPAVDPVLPLVNLHVLYTEHNPRRLYMGIKEECRNVVWALNNQGLIKEYTLAGNLVPNFNCGSILWQCFSPSWHAVFGQHSQTSLGKQMWVKGKMLSFIPTSPHFFLVASWWSWKIYEYLRYFSISSVFKFRELGRKWRLLRTVCGGNFSKIEGSFAGKSG